MRRCKLAKQLIPWSNPNITTLDNGLRVLTHRIAGATSISVNVSVRAGSTYESPTLSGVSHFLEHMLFKGTQNWPTPEILTGAIENTGGDINALTSKEYTMYWAKVPFDKWEIATDILLDMCINPLMLLSEIQRERNVIHEELSMYTDHPSYSSELGIEQVMFPNHPLGMEIIGTHQSLDELKPNDINEYFYQHYNPSNLIVTVVGNFSEDELIDSINEKCNGWVSISNKTFKTKQVPLHASNQLITFDQSSEHAYINLGLQGLESENDLTPLLDLINMIFGEGMSSRLFIKIRERLGLAYDISSATNSYADSGTWIINCSVKQVNCLDAIKAIIGELHSITHSVTAQELLNVQKYAKGKLLLAMEDTERLASMIGVRTLLSGKLLNFGETISQWDSFTLEQLKDLSQNLIIGTPKFLSISGSNISDDKLALEGLIA